MVTQMKLNKGSDQMQNLKLKSMKIFFGLILFSVATSAKVLPKIKTYNLTGVVIVDNANAKLIINPRSNSSYTFLLDNKSKIESCIQGKMTTSIATMDIQVYEYLGNDRARAQMKTCKIFHGSKIPTYYSDLVESKG